MVNPDLVITETKKKSWLLHENPNSLTMTNQEPNL